MTGITYTAIYRQHMFKHHFDWDPSYNSSFILLEFEMKARIRRALKLIANFIQVVVVGAGPCGLLAALYLQKEGIQVQVLDGAEQLDKQPRASHYSAPALVDLERAGVLQAMKERGFLPKSVCWRLKDGERIAGVKNDIMPESDPLRMVALPLGEVIDILYEEATAAGAEVLMQHLVQSQEQDKDKAWVNVKLPTGGIQKFEADYIIGCDGANSQIRRALFGEWEFPGTTWPKQIIATNVSYAPECTAWDRVKITLGLLRVRYKIRLGRLKLRCRPRRLVYGSENKQRWVVACHLRRDAKFDERRIRTTPPS